VIDHILVQRASRTRRCRIAAVLLATLAAACSSTEGPDGSGDCEAVILADAVGAGRIDAIQGPQSTATLTVDSANNPGGGEALRVDFDVTVAGAAGFSVSEPDGVSRDLADFQAGHIRLWVQSTVDLELTVRSVNQPEGLATSRIMLSSQGFDRNGLWEEIRVPVRELTRRDEDLDLSRVEVTAQLLVFGPVVGPAQGTFEVAEIVWTCD